MVGAAGEPDPREAHHFLIPGFRGDRHRRRRSPRRHPGTAERLAPAADRHGDCHWNRQAYRRGQNPPISAPEVASLSPPRSCQRCYWSAQVDEVL